MRYSNYTKTKVQAYAHLYRLSTPEHKMSPKIDFAELFPQLSVAQQFAIALDALDRSPCFCSWYEKGIVTAVTFPVLMDLFDKLEDTPCVHTLKLICAVRRAIERVYYLYSNWYNLDEKIYSELEQELDVLWDSYVTASDSLLTIADCWFGLN